MVGADWKIYGLAHLPCRAVFNVQCALPEKERLTGPEFVCCFAVLAGTALQHGGIWLGQTPQTTFPNYGELQAGAAPQQACCWARQQSRALIEQDLQISFSSDLERARAPAVARQPVWWLPVGQWLALASSAIYLQSEEQCLSTPGAGSWSPNGTRFRDGSGDLDTASREAGFPGRPLLTFPDEPQAGSSRRSRSGIPAVNTSPQLDPATCCAQPMTRSSPPVREGLPGILHLSVVHSVAVPGRKKGARSSLMEWWSWSGAEG